MVKFIKIFVLIIFLIIGGWWIARDFLPEDVVKAKQLQFIEGTVSAIDGQISNILTYLWPGDYEEKIKEVTAKQIAGVISSRRSRTILFYVYSLEDQASKYNLGDVNDMGSEFDKSALAILAVAIEDDRQKLADELNSILGGLNFKPLMMATDEEGDLRSKLKAMGSSYNKVPYMAVIDKSGTFIKIPTGIRRGNRIRSTIKATVK